MPIPMATMPCMHTLSDIIEPPTQEKSSILTDIAFTKVSYNIGAVAEKAYTNGVAAFAGTAYT